jgi:uncharacterized protein (DUF1778 family)
VNEVKQVMIRAAEEDHLRWKTAAEKAGTSMSDFVRDAANEAATKLLDCAHLNRKTYPWSSRCLDCGERLS